ncbi:hypothetical protein VF21_09929 [Pseudogymnoascus sp. 05NY08]|nr:hypothetical protein VF21_09929 [Pseudogymnoascus sp. 05NY08]
MTAQIFVIFVIGPPGAGKGTLSAYLTNKFPVQHISVGDLLRRIKNDNTDPQAEVLAYMLNKQELIDGKVLVPILKTELEELELRGRRKRGILVDGKQFAKPELVLFFNCPKEVARQRYLTRNLEGRETDDEAMFEKRYQEYVKENGAIISQYAGRGLLLEIGTGMGAEESREELCKKLDKNDKWSKIIGS